MSNKAEGRPVRRHRAKIWFLWGLAISLLVFSLLPRLGRMRPPAMRIACEANITAISKGIMLYQGDNGDQYPPDMARLIADGQSAGLFQCAAAVNFNITEDVEHELARLCYDGHFGAVKAILMERGDYLYIPGLRAKVSDSQVILFELPMNHSQLNVSWLLADGTVLREQPVQAMIQQLLATNDHLLRRRAGRE